MSEYNDIVNPLNGLPKLNCFKVPAGYFERLQQSIELRVALEALPIEQRLSALKHTAAFALPGNYFDSLANRIAHQTTAPKSLLDMEPVNGFAVPQGYFNTLYTRIADQISKGTQVAARPWWQPAPALRPVLAFAGITVIALAIAWPLFTNKQTGNAPVTVAENPVKNKIHQPEQKTIFIKPTFIDDDNNTAVANVVTPKKNKAAKAEAHPIATASYDDILSITGGSYNEETVLQEIPATADNSSDALVEILVEDIEIADIINSGM